MQWVAIVQRRLTRPWLEMQTPVLTSDQRITLQKGVRTTATWVS